MYPQRIVGNEPNLEDCFQHMYRRSDAETFGSVCLMVREKIGSQTDVGQTRQIPKNLFSRGKSAKNPIHSRFNENQNSFIIYIIWKPKAEKS